MVTVAVWHGLAECRPAGKCCETRCCLQLLDPSLEEPRRPTELALALSLRSVGSLKGGVSK
jgi:hypothetical protein